MVHVLRVVACCWFYLLFYLLFCLLLFLFLLFLVWDVAFFFQLKSILLINDEYSFIQPLGREGSLLWLSYACICLSVFKCHFLLVLLVS